MMAPDLRRPAGNGEKQAREGKGPIEMKKIWIVVIAVMLCVSILCGCQGFNVYDDALTAKDSVKSLEYTREEKISAQTLKAYFDGDPKVTKDLAEGAFMIIEKGMENRETWQADAENDLDQVLSDLK